MLFITLSLCVPNSKCISSLFEKKLNILGSFLTLYKGHFLEYFSDRFRKWSQTLKLNIIYQLKNIGNYENQAPVAVDMMQI